MTEIIQMESTLRENQPDVSHRYLIDIAYVRDPERPKSSRIIS